MKISERNVATKHRIAEPSPEPFDEVPLPMMDLDAKGVIVRANLAACTLYRLTREELLGHSAWDFIAADEIKQSRAAFLTALRKSQAKLRTIRRTFCDSKGGFHTCDMYRSFLADEKGERTGVRVVLTDVTESNAVQEDHYRASRRNESLLDSLSEAVVAIDPLGFIVYVNSAAERLLGWKAAELQGKLLENTLPLLDQRTGDQAILAMESAFDRLASAETLLLDSEGRPLHVEISSAPWVDKESGSTLGVISIIRRREKG